MSYNFKERPLLMRETVGKHLLRVHLCRSEQAPVPSCQLQRDIAEVQKYNLDYIFIFSN